MQTIYTPAELAEVIEMTEEPTRFTTLDEARDRSVTLSALTLTRTSRSWSTSASLGTWPSSRAVKQST